jgi:HSP20 family protein
MGSFPKESMDRVLYLRRELDRIFRDFFEHQKQQDGGGFEADFSLDVFETPDNITVEAELPGLERDKIEVSVLRDVIIIEGKKPEVKPRGQARYLCMERSYGKFRRVIELPVAGDTRLIKAEYDRGILRVIMPKIRERRGERCRVKIE